MSTLYSIDDCETFDVGQVHDLYRRYVNRSQVSLMTSFGFGRELVDRAEGAYLYLRDGRRILDFTGGVGVLNHGHNHPRILAARQRFAERRRMEVHKTYFSPYLAALGHNLAQLLPGDLSISFLPNSGAEAVEGAVKLAYKYHGGTRNTILRADISFHGKLLGSGSLTGAARTTSASPAIPGIVVFPYGDLDSVRAARGRAPRRRLRHPDRAVQRVDHALLLRGVPARAARAVHGRGHRADLRRDLHRLGQDRQPVLLHAARRPGARRADDSKSFGGGKSSISAYIAREPVFRKAYDNAHRRDAAPAPRTTASARRAPPRSRRSTSWSKTTSRAGHGDRGRVLGPGLGAHRQEHPDVVARVRRRRRAVGRVPRRRSRSFSTWPPSSPPAGWPATRTSRPS